MPVLRIAGAVHEPPRIPPLFALGGPVFLLGVFAPGLVALVLTAWEGGSPAVGGLLRRILRWRVGLRFYAFALLLMPLIKVAVAVLHRALVGTWPPFGDLRPQVLVIATVLSTVGQAGEELGWRGYLLPRLTAWTGLASASLIVGAVWAAWHLPLFFMPRAMLMHAAFNNTKDIVPSGAAHGTSPFTLDATLVFRLTVLLLWVAAALLLVRMRGVRRVG